MRRTGAHCSSSLPLWCQISIQVLGTLFFAAALVVTAVTDPEQPAPVQQAELR